MSLEYIRKTYGVPARRGVRVEYTGEGKSRFGTIKSATSSLNVKFDDSKHTVRLHPTWMLRYCV